MKLFFFNNFAYYIFKKFPIGKSKFFSNFESIFIDKTYNNDALYKLIDLWQCSSYKVCLNDEG